MKLEKQFGLYSIDTSFFYTDREILYSKKISQYNKRKKKLKKEYKKECENIKKYNMELKKEYSYDDYEKLSNQLKELYSQRKFYKEQKYHLKNNENNQLFINLENQIRALQEKKRDFKIGEMNIKMKFIKDTKIGVKYNKVNFMKNGYKRLLLKEFNKNIDIKREITKDLKPKNKIAMFESSLSRALGLNNTIENNEFTENLIIIRVYFYEVFQNIIMNGFYYKGEKYVLWSASAGQIRTKKCVFIKESIYKKIYNKINCGLTLKKINKVRNIFKNGVKTKSKGCNKNKYLAYTSLTSTASELWEDFDIDKSIVVDDFETIVKGVVDYIDYDKYDDNNLWSIERKEMDVTIPTMDGCGISLDYTGMFRLPWLKGLFCEFPFDIFIRKAIKSNPNDKTIGIVKDIYGKEHNVLNENIKYIFTKSQFKMWKYYDNWEQYKNYFKKYKCEACKCNGDIVKYKKATISYQPLQSLFEMTDDEITTLTNETNEIIKSICDNKDTALKVLGAVETNTKRNWYQEGLYLYPEMLTDKYSKKTLKDVKKSTVNKAKYGKITVDGTYTFIMPDVYAFSEWLFLHIENPKGLLKRGEVSCKLFKDGEELDMLRSPHLNFSHCINKNIINNEFKKWYKSNAIYCSCDSLDSLELMYDVDGDTSLVIKDKIIIDVAKRIREKYDIVPLYYKLRKAKDDVINDKTLYNGMISAYSGGNIGEVSNSISKIWNCGEVCKNELRAISYLTLWNNVVIDVAKTLWLPEKSTEMEKFLNQYTSKKLPHFFVYIKDKKKTIDQVEKINNSLVNRLNKIIQSPSINYNIKNCGKFDYKNLMSVKDIDIDTILAKKVIGKFSKDSFNISDLKHEDVENDNKNDYSNIHIREDMKTICGDINTLVNILVKYYYSNNIEDKRVLWEVYGDIIINNIKNNINLSKKMCEKCGKRFTQEQPNQKLCNQCSTYQPIGIKVIKCIDCGKEVEVDAKDNYTCRCEECVKLHKRELNRIRKQRQREKSRSQF